MAERLEKFRVSVEIETNKDSSAQDFETEEGERVADVLRRALDWIGMRFPEAVRDVTTKTVYKVKEVGNGQAELRDDRRGRQGTGAGRGVAAR